MMQMLSSALGGNRDNDNNDSNSSNNNNKPSTTGGSSSSSANNTDHAASMLSHKANNRDSGGGYYSWHLSLRVDRPLEGCALKPHAYMYSKKLDDRDLDKPLPSHSKTMAAPPPHHEFQFRWFRGPPVQVCAYDRCPRRTSFSPHDWSMHALGVTTNANGKVGVCALQCVSTQSSLYLCTFCNRQCFVHAWKTQYTLPTHIQQANSNNNNNQQQGYIGNYNPNNTNNTNNNSRATTPTPYGRHARSGSFDDDARSVGSTGSGYGGGSAPGTPRGGMMMYPTTSGGTPYYNNNNNNNNNNHTEETDEWREVSRDQLYMPGGDDIGRKLQLEATAYSTETGERLMTRVVKTDLVLARAPDPLGRPMLTLHGTPTLASHTSAASIISSTGQAAHGRCGFRVCSYNVLAEIYATQQQYPYCDFWALSWDYRFQNILREIIDASPEVACLQEVQADHYESHIYAAMSDAGYEGVFKQKTRQSMGLAGKVDGCALFWKRATFHLVESYSIEFNELAQRQANQLGLNTSGAGMRGRDNDEGMAFLNRLSKDNVAQLVVLELAQPPPASSKNDINTQVCIANTHLYSNKDFPDVKLWQCWQLLQELETFVMSRGGSPNSLPLIICGDFNSTPDTAVYELLSRQTVHPGHPDVNVNYTQQDGTDIPNILPDAINITHSFQLGSAYQTVLGEEPKQTNYTGHFKGVLDYVWYSIPSLRPLAAAPIPDEKMLTRHGEALPSTEYSSDHIMLISDFQMLSGNGNGK